MQKYRFLYINLPKNERKTIFSSKFCIHLTHNLNFPRVHLLYERGNTPGHARHHPTPPAALVLEGGAVIT